MPNQYTSERKPDIPRLDRDDIVDILYNMKVIDKTTDTDIVKWLVHDSGYNYGVPYAYSLIKDTNKRIRELYYDQHKHTLEACLGELYRQLDGAIKRGDNRLVLDIQKEINKVSGHYKERIEINQDVTFKVKWGN